jgi:hypothetical protein
VSLEELIHRTIRVLEAEGVPYMVTGSLASSYHGEYRATRDVDIVIDPGPAALGRLVDRLHAEGMYVDGEVEQAALRERGQFNAIVDDFKVDFIIHKHDPFSISEFGRRTRARLLDDDADVVTVEDLIISKLMWARDLDSQRQRRDVAGMIAVSGTALDRAYIDTWALRLGVADAWRQLTDEVAEPLVDDGV